MQTQDTTICGVDLVDVPALLDVEYHTERHRSRLTERELARWDDRLERFLLTERGAQLADEIRTLHGLTFVDDVGGGRWHLQGRGLHCGDALEILLATGHWLRVRFEVGHTAEEHLGVRNGRLPLFYIAAAGGLSVVGHVDVEWNRLVCRWPRG